MLWIETRSKKPPRNFFAASRWSVEFSKYLAWASPQTVDFWNLTRRVWRTLETSPTISMRWHRRCNRFRATKKRPPKQQWSLRESFLSTSSIRKNTTNTKSSSKTGLNPLKLPFPSSWNHKTSKPKIWCQKIGSKVILSSTLMKLPQMQILLKNRKKRKPKTQRRGILWYQGLLPRSRILRMLALLGRQKLAPHLPKIGSWTYQYCVGEEIQLSTFRPPL